ncbi:EI24 domain-containing protein [Altererythrobacter fulvus]|uniref:EI24 domain-containing protein n=1 Tax=Caenibius fulvus TaxID=2126012 RepID=UPI003018763B
MGAILSAMLRALGQLADPRILRLLAKTVGVSLILFVILGWLGWIALDWLLAWAGLKDAAFTGAGGVRGVVSFAITLIAGWLLWRVIAMGVISFYADEAVLAVEARYYPDAAARARDLPVREQLTSSLAAVGRALIANLIVLPFALALLVTGVGTALLFWAVNAVLLGRELSDMVWLRHRHAEGAAAPLSRGERFVLGGATAALLAVPFANFLAPVLGAASAAHLVHGKEKASNGAA